MDLRVRVGKQVVFHVLNNNFGYVFSSNFKY